MAAVVEIDESNGASETVTHGITGLAMGTADVPNMTPGGAGATQPISSSSMQKALRVHLTSLGGSLGIGGLRVFCDPSASGWTVHTNLSDVPATYATTKITLYVQPATTGTVVPNALPVAEPGGPNLGIGGSLTGQLTAAGASDYAYLQLRADGTVTASFSSPAYFAYDEVA